MARLFTISIPYKNHEYPALVTLRNQGPDISCLVRYADKQLCDILPGGVLIFSLAEGLKQPLNLSDQQAEELVNCTTEAIAHYLQGQDA
jgi:hypothetical protein